MDKKLYSASTQMTPVIYKDFYKIYYKERLRVFNIVATIIGIVMIAAGVYIYKKDFGVMWTLITVWIGAVLIVYPRMAYRKPCKRAKNTKQTTHFAFYEGYVSEKTNSQTTDYNYSSLQKIIETSKYLLIFHTMESVSIVDKANVKGDAEGLAQFLKSKAEYKKMKG